MRTPELARLEAHFHRDVSPWKQEMMAVTTDGTGAPVRQYEEKTREVKLGAVYLMAPGTAKTQSEPVEAYVRKGVSEAGEAELVALANATKATELKEIPAYAFTPPARTTLLVTIAA